MLKVFRIVIAATVLGLLALSLFGCASAPQQQTYWARSSYSRIPHEIPCAVQP